MMLCLDIGNTHIFGGLFDNDRLMMRFRHATYNNITSDQIGVFLKNVLRENCFHPNNISIIAISSVVNSINYSIRSASKKYFKIEPFFLTQETINENEIIIKTKNPSENGSDIIAGIIAATNNNPNENIIVVDFGTVTTIAAATKNKEYLGVTFIPGIHTSMNSLQINTARLFPVEIIKPLNALGRSTKESIQAGLFFGHIGAIKEIITRITKEVFSNSTKPLLIATGGFSHLFDQIKYFNNIDPDLILHGIKIAYKSNKNINCLV